MASAHKSARITEATSKRLTAECGRRAAETGERWSVDRLLNALLDEAEKRRKKPRKR